MKTHILSRLLVLLFLFSMIPAQAFSASSAYGLYISPYQGGFTYEFVSDQEYVLLSYATSAESGKALLHRPNIWGEFAGDIALPCTERRDTLTVTLSDLRGYDLLTGRAYTVSNFHEPRYTAHPIAPRETALRARNLTATPYPGGIQVDFDFPGYDLLILRYRSGQQSGQLPFYADENYHYRCPIDLAHTYAGSFVHIEIYIPTKDDPVGEIDGKCGYELVEKVAEPAEEGRLKGLLVCLDPGHGDAPGTTFEYIGPDMDGYLETSPGLCGQGHFTRRRESIVVLEIAYLTRDELRRQGAEVIMTREDEETFITSIPRAFMANDAGADFLIRLHADDREDDEDIRGVQVFCPLSSPYAMACCTPQEYRAMGEALMYAVRDGCGYPERARGNLVMLNDSYVGNNWAVMPCFLLEMGFLSNRQDDYRLSHPDFQQRMAESIAQGVYEMALLRGLITR